MSGDVLRVFVIAGEPSGDEIGGVLMAALRRLTGDKVRFSGVGGPSMESQGLRSLFPITEISVMGLLEILPHLPLLARRIRETAAAIETMSPDVVVTIDAPSFAVRVVKRLSRRSAPRIHYVAPSVWAWKPWRVHKFRRHFDMILALLPFEPPYFDKVGLSCRFVGHPVVEYGADRGDGPGFRARHGVAPESTLICVLLGSRRGEVSRHSEPFGGALERLAKARPGLRAVAPTVPGVAGMVHEVCRKWPVETVVVQGREEKYDAMAASDAALAASGTVAVEVALARLPAVVAYRISPVTAAILRRLALIRFASLTNLILDREVVPERLQDDCTPEILAAEIERLLGPDGEKQVLATAEALEAIGMDGARPSERAAQTVLEVVRAGA